MVAKRPPAGQAGSRMVAERSRSHKRKIIPQNNTTTILSLLGKYLIYAWHYYTSGPITNFW